MEEGNIVAKILVVDDKYFARVKLISVFDKNVHEVIEAESGMVAVQLYKEAKPDIVFCDLIMPEMDGIATLRQIKDHDPDAIVIIVTSLGVQSVLMEAISSGAKEVILKPFEEAKVLDTLNQFIK